MWSLMHSELLSFAKKTHTKHTSGPEHIRRCEQVVCVF